jgi:hypothetical protein
MGNGQGSFGVHGGGYVADVKSQFFKGLSPMKVSGIYIHRSPYYL